MFQFIQILYQYKLTVFDNSIQLNKTLSMNSNKGTRYFYLNATNIQDSPQQRYQESEFLNNLEFYPNDMFQMRALEERQADMMDLIEQGMPEMEVDDTDKYYQTRPSQLEFESSKVCDFTLKQQNEMLQQNISNKNEQEIIHPSDQRLYHYNQGHIKYISSLKTPIFGQNTRFDRTKRKTAHEGYFPCIARSMKRFKKNKLDTGYAKRFDQRLQKTLRIRALEEKQEKAMTLQALMQLNKARSGGQDSQILDNFQKRYNSKRHWAILLKRFVSSQERDESSDDSSSQH